MESIKLSNGHKMDKIGLGTWKSKAGEVEKAVEVAVDSGYRLIDCAYAYRNEDEVGQGLKALISRGVVKREELFVVSKLWNTKHHSDDVRPALRESLNSLGLEYIDLYLIHWPHAFKRGDDFFPKDDQGNVLYADIDFMDTWKVLEACVDDGLIKSIGLSNFNSRQVQRVLDESRIKPVNLQIEVHPYMAQERLVRFCQERGVSVTAYSPFASPDRPWAAPGEPLLLEEPTLQNLAKKHHVSTAQVVLRWLWQRDIISIPKSVTPSRIRNNFDINGFELSDEDMAAIKSLNRDERIVAPMVEVDGKRVLRDRYAPNFPFNIEF